jgi:hypothetical protein
MDIKEVQQKLEVVQGIMNDVQNMVDAAKGDFAAVIKDQSIPFKDRWELFCSAPIVFKETGAWIWHPKALESLGHNPWYDLIWCERYRTVYLVDYVSDWLYEYGIFRDEGDDPYVPNEDDQLTPEMVLALAEEVLSCNLASFTLDW